MKILGRPSFYIALFLIIIFGIIGLMGQYGVGSEQIIANGMDLMMWIGLGLAMAVIMSYAGYVSFGHTVFIGIGSFAAGYIVAVRNYDTIISTMQELRRKAIEAGLPPSSVSLPTGEVAKLFVTSIILASIMAVAVAVLVGYAVLRLRGAFFAIATIGLNYVVMYIVIFILKNYIGSVEGQELGNPSMGLTNIDFYWMHYIVFIITVLVAYYVRVSKLGYGLAAIREDEDAAEVVGVDTFRYKVIAFAIAGWLASLWGVAREFRGSFVAPVDFSLLNSVIMILENAIGGQGTFTGPIIGSLIYYPLKWYTQTIAGVFALVILGVLIIVVVSFAPNGIVGILRSRFPRLRKYLE